MTQRFDSILIGSMLMAVLFVFPASGQGVTLVLQDGLDGYDGTDDTTIYEDSPTLSNGGYTSFFAGRTNGTFATTLRRAAIRFDLSSIPSDAQVLAVTLTLVVENTASSSQLHTLHAIQKDWVEGTVIGGNRGGPSNSGDMTWDENISGTSTSTNSGGDFGSSSAQTFVSGNGSTALFSSSALEADVQGWLDNPSTNFGWMMVGNEGAIKTAKRFFSSEGFAPRRPALTIVYQPPGISEVSNWEKY